MARLIRLVTLDIAFVALAAALLAHSWAGVPEQEGYHSRMSSVSVGLRNFESTLGSESRTEPLRELNGMGTGFETKGKATFFIGLAAVASMIAASILLKKPRSLVFRIGLCVPLVASLFATLGFIGALEDLKYLSIGWGAWVALIAVIAGTVAIAWPARVSSDNSVA